jgi:hypothetical protein
MINYYEISVNLINTDEDNCLMKKCPICGCTKHKLFGCARHWLRHTRNIEGSCEEK